MGGGALKVRARPVAAARVCAFSSTNGPPVVEERGANDSTRARGEGCVFAVVFVLDQLHENEPVIVVGSEHTSIPPSTIAARARSLIG